MARLLDFGGLQQIVRRALAKFWRHVPEALFLPGLHLSDPKAFKIGALPVSDEAVDKIKTASIARSMDVVILPKACLVREISLPNAAASRAESAIALQLRQTLPNHGQGLVWRSVKTAASKETVTFLACILKQEQVDVLVKTLIASGAKIRSVRVEHSDDTALWSSLAHKDRVRRIGLIATVVAALLPAAVSTMLSNRDLAAVFAEFEETRERVESLQARLVEEKSAKGDTDAKRLDLVRAVGAFNNQSWRLQMLADLTGALPESVWVSELTIAEDQISLAGFSAGEVSEALTALQAISWVAKAQLDGPVSVDASVGESRFQVSLTVKNTDKQP